jgi:hypothetical protein
MSPETMIPTHDHRKRLIRRIEKMVSGIDLPDPELYAMLLLAKAVGRVPIGQTAHLERMAAVQFELVTNVNEEYEDEELAQRQPIIWQVIERQLSPQLIEFRQLKEVWPFRSRPYLAAFQDVAALQQKHFVRDKPRKDILLQSCE